MEKKSFINETLEIIWQNKVYPNPFQQMSLIRAMHFVNVQQKRLISDEI